MGGVLKSRPWGAGWVHIIILAAALTAATALTGCFPQLRRAERRPCSPASCEASCPRKAAGECSASAPSEAASSLKAATAASAPGGPAEADKPALRHAKSMVRAHVPPKTVAEAKPRSPAKKMHHPDKIESMPETRRQDPLQTEPEETMGSAALPSETGAERSKKPGEITVRWTTQGERGVKGFNILRSRSRNGPWSRVNAATISAAGQAKTPRTYEYLDRGVEAGKTYCYFLEEVSNSGERRMISGILSRAARAAQ